MAIGSRNRNFNVTLTDRFLYETRPLTGGAWSTQVNATSTDRVAILTVNNPWRDRKPDGDVPTARQLDYLGAKSPRGETKFVGGQEHWRHGVFAAQQSFAVNVTTASQRSDLVNRAVLQALTKLKDQKFNAGVAIAEAEGVARMVYDAANTTVAIRDFLRYGSFKEAYQKFRQFNPHYPSYPVWRKRKWDKIKHIESVRRARLIPEGWLYYHYGLAPTVNDIDGACQELILKARTNPNYFKGKVIGYAKVRTKTSTLFTADALACQHVLDAIESVRVVLHVSPKDGIGGKLSTLGVTNTAEAIWNRTAFSFLADYFIGIGEWLHVLDAWVGWDFGDWEECYRFVRNVAIVPDERETAKLAKLTLFHVLPGMSKRKTLDRVIHNTLYGPMAYVHPRVKIPSVNQLASILSLLATSFKRPVRP